MYKRQSIDAYYMFPTKWPSLDVFSYSFSCPDFPYTLSPLSITMLLPYSLLSQVSQNSSEKINLHSHLFSITLILAHDCSLFLQPIFQGSVIRSWIRDQFWGWRRDIRFSYLFLLSPLHWISSKTTSTIYPIAVGPT